MKVLIDTCVWSEALRKGIPQNSLIIEELSELIGEVRVQLFGTIRQELLSGIKSIRQFNLLKHYLSAFPDLALETQDFEKAAELFNICRKKGVQGSNTDFLICAIAIRYDLEIFTIDKDFENYQRHIPIKFHKIRSKKRGL